MLKMTWNSKFFMGEVEVFGIFCVRILLKCWKIRSEKPQCFCCRNLGSNDSLGDRKFFDITTKSQVMLQGKMNNNSAWQS